MKRLLGVGLMALVLVALAPVVAVAANAECKTCHEGGAGAPGGPTDFAEPTVVRTSACVKCHWLGAHPYHNVSVRCSACHPGWGSVDSRRIPRVWTPAGWFASAESQDAGGAELHEIHLTAAWPAGADKPNSRCASCHAVAGCSTCHEDTGPHGDHTYNAASGTRSAPVWSGRAGYGTPVGDQRILTATTGVTCAASACHDIGSFQPSVPVEDSSPLISYEGAWRASLSASAYSGGSARITDVTGASASVTLPEGAFTVIGTKNYLSGIAAILIDGVQVASVDAYSPTSINKQTLYSGEIPPGTHTVTIRVTGARNANALGTRFTLDAFGYSPSSSMKTPECESCHASRHAGMGEAHRWDDSAACAKNCHGTTLPSAHEPYGVDCQGCHLSSRMQALAGADAGGKCDACHAVQHSSMSAIGNTFCYDCHGTTSAGMSAVASEGAYIRTGGDHETGYAASAHGSLVAVGNDAGVESGIQCEACHSKAAAGSRRIVDYRTSGAMASDVAQEKLCLKCHSASGEETRSAGGLPYTWNGRDIAAEFARVSHHPLATADTAATSVIETLTAFSQGTNVEFDMDQKVYLSAISTQGAELAWDTYAYDPGVRKLMYFMPGNAGTAWYQYDPTIATWNGWQYAPPGHPSTGASFGGYTAVAVNGKVYVGPGGGSFTRWVYQPADGNVNGVWLANSNFPTGVSWGADSAVDESHGYVYYSRSSSDATILKWVYGNDTWASNMQARDASGTSFVLGVGSSISYSPRTDKLFVIRRANTNVMDGHLYSVSSPSTKSGQTTFTDTGLQVTRNDATRAYTHMVRIDRAGADYLVVIGQDDTGTLNLQVIGDLGASTPTKTKVGLPPFPSEASYALSLEWDGGDYLYACDVTGITTRIARIRIPVDPVAGPWGAWEDLSRPASTNISGVMAFQNAHPKAFTTTGYRSSGTISAVVEAPRNATTWGRLEVLAEKPASTMLAVKVQGWNGSSFVDLPGFEEIVTSSADLSSISVTAFPRLRLVATLSTGNVANTPRLKFWSVSARRPRTRTATASLTCVNCHGAHSVRAGDSQAWDVARVSDPASSAAVWADGATPDSTSFCLACHSAAVIDRRVDTDAIVPYDIRFSDQASGFFPGWDKDAGATSFRGSGHSTTAGTKALCENCHDPHGSSNPRLAAWTRPASFAGGSAGVRDNVGSSAFEENLCYQCHGNGTLGVKAPGAPDVASPASGAYRHPVETAGRHSDVEMAGALGVSNRHSECTDCHDPHAARPGLHADGTSRPGPVLRGATGVKPSWSATAAPGDTAVSYVPVRIEGSASEAEAYVCFKCHTSVTTLPTSGGTTGHGATDLAAEFNPANYSYHNVMGLSTGTRTQFLVLGQTTNWGLPTYSWLKPGWSANSPMTCTSCHTAGSEGQAKGPHGSSVKFMLDPAYPGDWETAMLDFGKPSGVSENIICLKCHVMVDGGSNTVHGADGLLSNPHSRERCTACHVRIPHGWKRPRLLGYVTDPQPYRTNDGAGYGLRGVSIRSHNSNSWYVNDCSANCTSIGSHNSGFSGALWP